MSPLTDISALQQKHIFADGDRHHCDDLIQIFNALFQDSEHTILVRGDDEPLYLPASATGNFHQIIFAHGFYASALHEIAHWCVAGPERRQLEDYGYWYEPDGRSEQQQRLFEQVEIIPQAIERCFCLAAGFRFRISADNLNGAPGDTSSFEQNVIQQSEVYLHQGLPDRAQRFFDALLRFYPPSAKSCLTSDRSDDTGSAAGRINIQKSTDQAKHDASQKTDHF